MLPSAYGNADERREVVKERDKNFRNVWMRSGSDFVGESATVITPDNVSLHVKLIKHKNSNASTPTIIFFNGNKYLSKISVVICIFS